jgi:hypothetical protein
MDLVSIVAAVGNGSGDLVVGLLVGACIGSLVAPAFRSWQSHREWVEASREDRLADRLLMRLETDAELDAIVGPPLEDPRPSDARVQPGRSTWRTSH